MFRSVRNAFCLLSVVCLILLCSLQLAFASEFLSPDLSGVDLQYPYFVGSLWIKAHENSLGDVEIYVPSSSYQSFGLNSDGYLVNVTSSSSGGVMYDSSGNQYQFSCSGFSLPRYRLSNSSGYQYTDGYFRIIDSNMDIAYRFANRTSFATAYPYLILGFVGVILVCLLRYKR